MFRGNRTHRSSGERGGQDHPHTQARQPSSVTPQHVQEGSRRSQSNTRTSGASRRQQRQMTRQQYHLVADEIESLLLDEAAGRNADQLLQESEMDNEEQDDSGDSDEDDHDDPTSTPRTRRSNLGALSLHASLPSVFSQAASSAAPRTRDDFLNPENFDASPRPVTSRLNPLRNFRRRRSAADADKSSVRRRRSSIPRLREQDVNAYDLFDSPGADEARHRASIRQARRTSCPSSTNTFSGSSDAASEGASNRTVSFAPGTNYNSSHGSGQNFVIYDANKYGATNLPFFTPILVLLAVIFVFLLVVRVVVGLLTMAVGWLFVALYTIFIFQELLCRPVQLICMLHRRPVVAWSGLGAILGLGAKAVTLFQDGELLLTLFPASTAAIGSGAASEPLLNLVNDMFGMSSDLRLVPNMLGGAMVGLQIGLLWYGWLGTASEPSIITVWIQYRAMDIYRLFRQNRAVVFLTSGCRQMVLRWNRLASYLQQLMAQYTWAVFRRVIRPIADPTKALIWMRNLMTRPRYVMLQCIANVFNTPSGKSVDIDPRDSDRRQCMICLEGFVEEKLQRRRSSKLGDENVPLEDRDDLNISSLYRRRFLRCGHCFHAHCVQEWFSISASCPICRVPSSGPVAGILPVEGTASRSN